MILEAFSKVLHTERERTGQPAVSILHRWLLGQLSDARPLDNIGRVIHCEVEMIDVAGSPTFISRSSTGEILLKSLYLYCDSYEHWQFRRWLHQVNASTFSS